MYYITNYNDQIIAADESLLQSLKVENIDDLIKKIILEKISLNIKSSNKLQIVTETDTYSYTVVHSNLSSMLGNLSLIHLEKIEENTDDTKSFMAPEVSEGGSLVANIIQEAEEEIASESKLEDVDFLLDEASDETLLELDEKEETEQLGDSADKTSEILENEEELYDLSAPDVSAINDDLVTPELDDNELFDLALPTEPLETIDNISLDIDEDTNDSLAAIGVAETSKQTEPLDTDPIVINIQKVSDSIGISTDDYKTFLNDYIDTAISLEEELQSNDENERSSAISTLTQLADVLQLPKVNEIIQEISIKSTDERPHTVESFYQTLSRLTTEENKNLESSQEDIVDEVVLDLNETNDISLDQKEEKAPSRNGFGKIYLEDVKPIHFDFQLESAANDLSLPVELIEEFVHDFIEQGHIETKKMLQAFEEGDLDTIQKIGHLLKGASSNLRINALSDTLYDIQFCEDDTKLEDLIERYWAHFISFEQQIDMITK